MKREMFYTKDIDLIRDCYGFKYFFEPGAKYGPKEPDIEGVVICTCDIEGKWWSRGEAEGVTPKDINKMSKKEFNNFLDETYLF